MITDTPTHRTAINELSLDDLDAELDALRDRRLHLANRLVQLSAVKRAQHLDAAVARFEKGRLRLRRSIEKLEETTTKVEHEMNKLRAVLLEIEDIR